MCRSGNVARGCGCVCMDITVETVQSGDRMMGYAGAGSGMVAFRRVAWSTWPIAVE